MVRPAALESKYDTINSFQRKAKHKDIKRETIRVS